MKKISTQVKIVSVASILFLALLVVPYVTRAATSPSYELAQEINLLKQDVLKYKKTGITEQQRVSLIERIAKLKSKIEIIKNTQTLLPPRPSLSPSPTPSPAPVQIPVYVPPTPTLSPSPQVEIPETTAPTVASVAPTSGPLGTTIKLNGNFFKKTSNQIIISCSGYSLSPKLTSSDGTTVSTVIPTQYTGLVGKTCNIYHDSDPTDHVVKFVVTAQ